jgi:carbon storage regulator
MLVLTRKPGEALYIGDNVKVTLQGIRGNQVRLGIEAPPSVKIYREEIYAQILEENRSAAGVVGRASPDISGVVTAWKDTKSKGIKRLMEKANEQNVPEDDDGE